MFRGAKHTENLIAAVVFLDEFSKELLIHASSIDDLDHFQRSGERSVLLEFETPTKAGDDVAKKTTNSFLACVLACLLAYRSIPERAAQFHRFQKHRFGFLIAQALSKAEADAHGPEPRNRDLDVAKGERLDHVESNESVNKSRNVKIGFSGNKFADDGWNLDLRIE
jgi:hypothetical protein